MTKAEAERLVRSLSHVWLRETHCSVVRPGDVLLSASDFIDWLGEWYPEVLRFGGKLPAADAIEQWFDQELMQTWRN